ERYGLLDFLVLDDGPVELLKGQVQQRQRPAVVCARVATRRRGLRVDAAPMANAGLCRFGSSRVGGCNWRDFARPDPANIPCRFQPIIFSNGDPRGAEVA